MQFSNRWRRHSSSRFKRHSGMFINSLSTMWMRPFGLKAKNRNGSGFLKREFLAIKDRGGVSAEIGENLLEEVKRIFKAWHELKAGSLSREQFRQEIEPVQARVRELFQQGAACEQAKTRGTCENLLKQEVSLWTFVREEGVEPTNNNAEVSSHQIP